MKVDLHIEQIVLDGVALSPSQRRTFSSAAEGELGRLLSAGGLSTEVASGIAVPRVDGGALPAATTPFDPVSFGNEVARAVYRGIGRQPE